MQRLPDNWDGYGSPRIAPTLLRVVRRLLLLVEQEARPTFRILPVAGGGVQLELDCGPRTLEFEVLPDGSLEYLTLTSDEPQAEGPLAIEDRASLARLLMWLRAGDE